MTNRFTFSDSDLIGLDSDLVDWEEIRRRVDLSIDALGVNAVKDHYWTAIWAFEDQLGGCPGTAEDAITKLINHAIEQRI